MNSHLPLGEDGSVWVFGYGSLMWKPGFVPADIERARVQGYQRRFCIYSVHHRGSPDRPGLVLGLDRGGACEGLALRIPAASIAETLGYLRSREQINGVYRETRVWIDLVDQPGRRLMGIAFTAERAHPSYAGLLPLMRQAQLIRAATGRSGANLDYLFATLDQLQKLGIRDRELVRLLPCIGPHFNLYPPSATSSKIGAHSGGIRLASKRFPVIAPLMRPGDRRRFTHRCKIIEWGNFTK